MDRSSNSTVIVNEHLNVKERLAQLEAWRDEWKRDDDRLAAQVAQLDPSKPHDVLCGAQIASLRRRLHVQRVKVPLEISIADIQRIGYKRLRQHLVQQFAQLTTDERLRWLDNFLFIMTPDLHLLHDKIATLCSDNTQGQRRNLLLGGSSGMGKTTYLNWHAYNYRPKVNIEHNQVPVIKIDAPIHNSSAKPLFQRLLLECGAYSQNRSDKETLLMRLITYLQQRNVEVVIVDEIEHLMRSYQRRRLLEISNLTPDLPFICASCEPLRWIEDDSEIANRWNNYFELHQYAGERLREFLACIELLLPFPEPSLFPKHEITTGMESGKVIAGPAHLIERWTGGMLRDIMGLIVEASASAIKRSLPCLTTELLAETWETIRTLR